MLVNVTFSATELLDIRFAPFVVYIKKLWVFNEFKIRLFLIINKEYSNNSTDLLMVI